jgi:hypothetical protein
MLEEQELISYFPRPALFDKLGLKRQRIRVGHQAEFPYFHVLHGGRWH